MAIMIIICKICQFNNNNHNNNPHLTNYLI